MIRNLMLCGLFLLANGAYADSNTIEITSFQSSSRPAYQYTYSAEVCGKVTYADPAGHQHMHLRVSTDYNSRNPSHYNTMVGADGKFCLAVVTYNGTVEVRELDGEGTPISATLQAQGTVGTR